MRSWRNIRTLAFAVLLGAVAIGWYTAGWPVAQRMEEYLAFVSTGPVQHGELVAGSAVVWGEAGDNRAELPGTL